MTDGGRAALSDGARRAGAPPGVCHVTGLGPEVLQAVHLALQARLLREELLLHGGHIEDVLEVLVLSALNVHAERRRELVDKGHEEEAVDSRLSSGRGRPGDLRREAGPRLPKKS